MKIPKPINPIRKLSETRLKLWIESTSDSVSSKNYYFFLPVSLFLCSVRKKKRNPNFTLKVNQESTRNENLLFNCPKKNDFIFYVVRRDKKRTILNNVKKID